MGANLIGFDLKIAPKWNVHRKLQLTFGWKCNMMEITRWFDSGCLSFHTRCNNVEKVGAGVKVLKWQSNLLAVAVFTVSLHFGCNYIDKVINMTSINGFELTFQSISITYILINMMISWILLNCCWKCRIDCMQHRFVRACWSNGQTNNTKLN